MATLVLPEPSVLTLRNTIDSAIVSYAAICRWGRQTGDYKPRGYKRPNRKPNEIRELVVKIARETGWGYTRILGELRKLNIHDISRQTVVNILKEAGHNPYAQRGLAAGTS